MSKPIIYGYVPKTARSLALRGPSGTLYNFNPSTPMYPISTLDHDWLEVLTMTTDDTPAKLRRVDAEGKEVSPQSVHGKKAKESIYGYVQGKRPIQAPTVQQFGKTEAQTKSELIEAKAQEDKESIEQFCTTMFPQSVLGGSIQHIIDEAENFLTTEDLTSTDKEVAIEVRVIWARETITHDPDNRVSLPTKFEELVTKVTEVKESDSTE